MAISISRFLNRERAEFTVEVLTPMFLGGADGNAELRSAPFKNAIRYWWRITQGDIPHTNLLQKEQQLFGGVTNEAVRSRVDVVLTGSVRTGKVDEEDFIGKKYNPEAGKNVSLAAYLGMGPVHFKGKYTKKRILPSEKFSLLITFPTENRTTIIDTLSLFREFGSLGARSRNGWGGFDLKAENRVSLLSRKDLFNKYGEELRAILDAGKKYPFRLGKTDGRPLLWEIGSKATWQDAMKEAGIQYMDLRQQALPFPHAKPVGVQKRHILGYPVTGHNFKEWGGGKGRMPSQLRIVIRKQNNEFIAYFFHLPHKIPKPWDSRLDSEFSVWQAIHKHLDQKFPRII